MPRGAVISLTAAVALGIAVFFSLYSLIPVTRSDEPGLSSLFEGTMMACVMGVEVFTPTLVRRFSLRLVLVASLGLLGVGALITGFARSTFPLLVGAVASGAAFGTVVVAGAQGIGLLVSAGRLGKTLGTYGLVTMAASALGSPAGVQLALTFSSHVFGVCALVGGLLAAGLSFGVPGAVGKTVQDAPAWEGRRRGASAFVAGTPWAVLGLLLAAVILLSHGLTSLPVLAASFGSAAVVVFAVQVGNALGRGIGGQLEARITTLAALIAGAMLLVSGGALGALTGGWTAAIVAGALIGLGVGIVQTVALHTTMRRMDSGRGSVLWNLAVDGGLWAGGILWGLAITSGFVGAGALIFSVVVLVLGGAVVFRLRRN